MIFCLIVSCAVALRDNMTMKTLLLQFYDCVNLLRQIQWRCSFWHCCRLSCFCFFFCSYLMSLTQHPQTLNSHQFVSSSLFSPTPYRKEELFACSNLRWFQTSQFTPDGLKAEGKLLKIFCLPPAQHREQFCGNFSILLFPPFDAKEKLNYGKLSE